MIRCHVANRQLEAQSSGSVLEMVQTDHLNARAIETCPPFEGPESSDSLFSCSTWTSRLYSLCLLWSPDTLFDPPHHQLNVKANEFHYK